jgi:hypothetical protein
MEQITSTGTTARITDERGRRVFLGKVNGWLGG